MSYKLHMKMDHIRFVEPDATEAPKRGRVQPTPLLVIALISLGIVVWHYFTM